MKGEKVFIAPRKRAMIIAMALMLGAASCGQDQCAQKTGDGICLDNEQTAPAG